jgi:hypothetical protein
MGAARTSETPVDCYRLHDTTHKTVAFLLQVRQSVTQLAVQLIIGLIISIIPKVGHPAV